jgi:hypothetical protein
MSTDSVLKNIQDVIRIKTLEIKKKKSCTSDEIRQLTGLINSYTRLKFKNEETEDSGEHDGDPTYYDNFVLNNGGK